MLAVLPLVVASAVTAGRDADPGLRARQQSLDEIERQVNSIKQELSARNADRRALIEELAARERTVAELSLTHRELERRIAEHQRNATELRARQAKEQAALDVELVHLSKLLRTAYVLGRADRLRLLLNQEDPERATRVMSYFAYFNRERMRRVHAVQERAEQLERLARAVEDEVRRLAEEIQRQEITRQRLEQARQERTQVLHELEATIHNRAATLEGLKHEAESLRLLVEHLRQQAQIQAELNIQPVSFAEMKGRLSWPLLEGRILAPFGSRKRGSELTWDGVLLAVREGEEVRAVKDGRVVYADWLRGFGLLIVLDHGDGYMTLYGHNKALLREVGEWVASGDPIALSSDGSGSDASLYFAIRYKGRPQDPAVWCTSEGRYSVAQTLPK
ncbi:murein hydrolase activator EnvC family protein [Caldichromatium japonicum]|nr:peptidoglycan DD-metalloendopeptidase family protein [Caldichromatium japonicum]